MENANNKKSENLISAIATPAGIGGVAIVRVSGEGALSLAAKMFKPGVKIKVADFEPYKMYIKSRQNRFL